MKNTLMFEWGMTSFSDRLHSLHLKIRKAERLSEREEGATQLIAVSKNQPMEILQEALQSGQRLFGENRVQEAQKHWTHLRLFYPDLRLHLIGPLQTNKVSEACALFDVIETLDREKLALALSKDKEQSEGHVALECYIQVNTGQEPQKAGILPQEFSEFLKFCLYECKLNVTGLMCIPPVDEPAALHFALLKKMAAAHSLKNLSMGMSADYQKAIALGATHIRIGTALFGARSV